MNKKILITLACIVLFFMSGLNVEANSIEKMEKNLLESIDIEDSLIQEDEEYYLYFYRTACPYCVEVSDVIDSLSKQHKVYTLNCDIEKNRGQKYDWSSSIHFPKEIGYINEAGDIIYYPGESEEKYLNSNDYDQYGHRRRYKIYSNIPDGQDTEMIYAKMITPEINYAEVNNWKQITIAGVPTLLHVTNGRIDEFYFDYLEIKELLYR